MNDYQIPKAVVSAHYAALDAAPNGRRASVMAGSTAADYKFRGVHPFNELSGVEAVAEKVWEPLYRSLTSIQRRQDVFMAGTSEIAGDTWVCSMGHLMGLLDHEWLGIPATGKLAFLRYAEFHRISGERIAETAFFCDIISVMKQAGLVPLPPQTGADFIVPGPRTHDGLLFERQDAEEGAQTLALANAMRADLARFRNQPDPDPTQTLARTWKEGMLWFGPSGIGGTYTIERYHEQHQGPFRDGLSDVKFNGHVCRIAEGNYASWFGWPNLTMTPRGGLLGLPSTTKRVDMRVVDVYRREGTKLAENWIFIDLPYYLLQQDVDVLERTRRVTRRG